MRRAKRRIFSGTVCEQIVYSVPQGTRNIGNSKPRLRFKDEGERASHREGISRRKFIRLINANFSPTSIYSTLTLDNAWEVHTWEEAIIVMNRYIRRLQYRYPAAKLVLVKGRGKATGRIHFHMVSQGVPLEEIQKVWGMGEVVRAVHLREHNFYEIEGKGKVDHGQDYTGLANYLFDHWTEDQGGHRWRQTRNMAQPEVEEAREAIWNYTVDKPPMPPKGYVFVVAMENKFGYILYKYVKISERKRRRE